MKSSDKKVLVRRRRDGSVEMVNPARRARKKLGLSGRQSRIARKAARRRPDVLGRSVDFVTIDELKEEA